MANFRTAILGQRSQTAAAWQSDQTVGVAPRRRARKHAAAKHIY